MVQAPVELLTLEAFLEMPETKPASEFINGRVIQKPMPKPKHSVIQGELVTAINGVLKSKRIGYAFPELRCTFGSRSIVPDISVLKWERLPIDENGDLSDDFEGHPDWAIEILSPQQSYNLVLDKILHALNHGTEMGWLIDPTHRTILICPAGAQPQNIEEMGDRLPTPSFAESVSLTRGDLFSYLKM